jgi:hypothetical protein
MIIVVRLQQDQDLAPYGRDGSLLPIMVRLAPDGEGGERVSPDGIRSVP